MSFFLLFSFRLNRRSLRRWRKLMTVRRKKTPERGPSPEVQGGQTEIHFDVWSVFITQLQNLCSHFVYRRRKTRSPSPRRRSPVKRERKHSASRSPRRKPSPAGGGSPPPPLMQLPTKPLEQTLEPEVPAARTIPEAVIPETNWCVDWLLWDGGLLMTFQILNVSFWPAATQLWRWWKQTLYLKWRNARQRRFKRKRRDPGHGKRRRRAGESDHTTDLAPIPAPAGGALDPGHFWTQKCRL